jgi:hypothetical protein
VAFDLLSKTCGVPFPSEKGEHDVRHHGASVQAAHRRTMQKGNLIRHGNLAA